MSILLYPQYFGFCLVAGPHQRDTTDWTTPQTVTPQNTRESWHLNLFESKPYMTKSQSPHLKCISWLWHHIEWDPLFFVLRKGYENLEHYNSKSNVFKKSVHKARIRKKRWRISSICERYVDLIVALIIKQSVFTSVKDMGT